MFNLLFKDSIKPDSERSCDMNPHNMKKVLQYVETIALEAIMLMVLLGVIGTIVHVVMSI